MTSSRPTKFCQCNEIVCIKSASQSNKLLVFRERRRTLNNTKYLQLLIETRFMNNVVYHIYFSYTTYTTKCQKATDISNKVIFQMSYDMRAFSLFNVNYIFHELWQAVRQSGSRKLEEGKKGCAVV